MQPELPLTRSGASKLESGHGLPDSQLRWPTPRTHRTGINRYSKPRIRTGGDSALSAWHLNAARKRGKSKGSPKRMKRPDGPKLSDSAHGTTMPTMADPSRTGKTARRRRSRDTGLNLPLPNVAFRSRPPEARRA